MKHIAVIFAGGTGQRMNLKTIPKQFLNLYGKPILCYTLDQFQMHEDIDAIIIVMLEKWIDYTNELIRKYNYTKVVKVVPGGETGQESIRNGVFSLEGKAQKGDIVIVHDGIRPIVDDIVLNDIIVKAKQYGNAVTSLPYNEQIFIVNPEDETTTKQYIPRETLRRVSTPQAYEFEELDAAYHEAFEKEIGIYGSAYTNTMWVELGKTLHFAAGSDKNIKLTTKDDLEIFKSYINANKDNN